MKFIQKAEKLFPFVKFTGGSDIHASYAVNFQTHVPYGQVKEVMQNLHKHKAAHHILNQLKGRFPNLDWLVTPEEFYALLMVDYYRQVQGKASSLSSTMLQNPETGNIFHVVALMGNISFGIRFWEEHRENNWSMQDPYAFGFRFRLEEADEEEETTRTRTRQVCEEALQVMSNELNNIIEVPEPKKAKTSTQVEEFEIIIE